MTTTDFRKNLIENHQKNTTTEEELVKKALKDRYEEQLSLSQMRRVEGMAIGCYKMKKSGMNGAYEAQAEQLRNGFSIDMDLIEKDIQREKDLMDLNIDSDDAPEPDCENFGKKDLAALAQKIFEADYKPSEAAIVSKEAGELVESIYKKTEKYSVDSLALVSDEDAEELSRFREELAEKVQNNSGLSPEEVDELSISALQKLSDASLPSSKKKNRGEPDIKSQAAPSNQTEQLSTEKEYQKERISTLKDMGWDAFAREEADAHGLDFEEL